MISFTPYDALLQRLSVVRANRELQGSQTAFWSYGEEEAETTIVMVHGFRGDHHGLEPIVAHLGSAGYRILLPDLPGFGESTPMNIRHNIAGYASWLTQFVAEVVGTRSKRIVIVGHSFGSIIVSAATAGGLRADQLVLINPIAASALSGPHPILTRLAVLYYDLSARLPEKLGFALLRNKGVVRIMSVTMAKTRDTKLRRWIHQQHDQYFSVFSHRRVVLEAFEASVSHDVSQYAQSIQQPTLLIAADRDDITPLAAQEKLQNHLPHAHLVVLRGVGHLVHYEVPDEAAAAIARFLDAPFSP